MYNKSLIFSVKLAKSRTSKGWSISRDSILPLIPKLPYETECDIIVEGVHAKARLNLEPRLFYKSTQTELINCLDKLIEENVHERIEVEMLLNQDMVDNVCYNEVNQKLLEIIDELKKENDKLKQEISDYHNKNNQLISRLEELYVIIKDD